MNRRTYVATGVAVTATGMAGCQSRLWGETVDGTSPWVQNIDVLWEHEGTQFDVTLLTARFDGDATVYGEVATEVEGVVASLTDIRVAEELHDDLQDAFDEVRYLVGFCWDDTDGEACTNPTVSRDTFNAVQFNDRVDIRVRNADVEIRDVDTGAGPTPTDRTTLHTFDFAQRHENRNPPSW